MLQRLLSERDWLLADGAMATNLFSRGLPPDTASECWLIEHPEAVRELHRAFVAAGCDILLTNTFGANRHRLLRCGLADRVRELNRIAVDLARVGIRDADRPIVIAGSIGPTGLSGAADMRAAFSEQVAALQDAGADCIWFETVSSAAEADAAVRAAAAFAMPYVITATVDASGRMLDGQTAAAFTRSVAARTSPPLAIGINCSEGPTSVIDGLRAMASAVPDVMLVAKANKGMPQVADGKLDYRLDTNDMRDYAIAAHKAGARIIGGCCGTTPADIAAMRRALEASVRTS